MEEERSECDLHKNLSYLSLQEKRNYCSMETEEVCQFESIRTGIAHLYIAEKRKPEEIIETLLQLKFYHSGSDLSEKIMEIKDKYLQTLTKDDIARYLQSHASLKEPSKEALKGKYQVTVWLPEKNFDQLKEEELKRFLLGSAYYPWQYDDFYYSHKEMLNRRYWFYCDEIMEQFANAYHYGIVDASNYVGSLVYSTQNSYGKDIGDHLIKHNKISKDQNLQRFYLTFEINPVVQPYQIGIRASGGQSIEAVKRWMENILHILKYGCNLNGK